MLYTIERLLFRALAWYLVHCARTTTLARLEGYIIHEMIDREQAATGGVPSQTQWRNAFNIKVAEEHLRMTIERWRKSQKRD